MAKIVTSILALSLGLVSAGWAQAQIFADGFESGDLAAWYSTPPAIRGVTPVVGAYVTSARPQVSVTFLQSLTPIDPASVTLTVDQLDHSAEVEITDHAILWLPPKDLEGETLHFVEVGAADASGNRASKIWIFSVDLQAPAAQVVAPVGVVLEDQPEIRVSFYDALGVNPDSVALRVDGNGSLFGPCVRLSQEMICQLAQPLPPGPHRLDLSVADFAGRSAEARGEFEIRVDHDGPMLAVTSPLPGALVAEATVAITGTVQDASGGLEVLIDGIPAVVDGGTFSGWAALDAGSSSLEIRARDLGGNETTIRLDLVLDTQPPKISITSPGDGAFTNIGQVRIAGRVEDESGIATLTANGEALALIEGRFDQWIPLDPGVHLLEVRASDLAGNVATRALSLEDWTLPGVVITSPPDLSTLTTTTVTVAGTVDVGAGVVVNGIAATVVGTGFEAIGVPLLEGGNLLTATATDALGHQAADTVVVVRDVTPPRISIDEPPDGATVTKSRVRVSGLVNDLVAGTVGALEVTVTVNGVAAEVVNRSFAAYQDLVAGSNTLLVTAIDESGNTGTAEATIYFVPALDAHLEITAGDHQIGMIGALLAAPLEVQALDASGHPVAGVNVIFGVEQGSGVFANGDRQVEVQTGADGLAATSFRLGMRSGVANHRIVAQAVGFGAPLRFDADALAGPPAWVLADAGLAQIGVAGQSLPRPLVAVVTDAGFNRLPAVPVTFAVVRGAGFFPGSGKAELVVLTDSDGRAIVEVATDAEEGQASTVVEAMLDPDVGSKAVFVGSGLAAGDPAFTAIEGVVLDNSGLPLEGVTLRLRDSKLVTQTDAGGRFLLRPAPVGTLYMLVDGSTVNRPGAWPDLEYVVTTVPGRTVDVGMPIHLLPLDLAGGVYVDEVTGATLELPTVPGFRLEIAPGSVTFPGGGRTGTVSATVVHHDRVPMTPNFGQQPRLIVTIQPSGARFEPPARLVLPNVEGLAPGEVTEMYSFDHDLGHFVSIGPASVSSDGAEIVADKGVGIVKAGWHCGGNPAPSGTTHDCPPCTRCDGSQCVPEFERGVAEPLSCGECKVSCACTPNGPAGDDVTVGPIEPISLCAAPRDVPITFSTRTNAPDQVDWRVYTFHPDPTEGPGSGVGEYDLYSYTFPQWTEKSSYRAAVSALCPGGRGESKILTIATSCSQFTNVELKECKQQGMPSCLSNGTVQIGTFGLFRGGVEPGANTPPRHQHPEVGVVNCADGSPPSTQICSALVRLDYNYAIQIDLRGRIPLEEGAEDDPLQVNKDLCTYIIRDLAPRMKQQESSVCGATNVNFLYLPAERAHEAKHEELYREKVVEPLRSQMSGLLAGCDCHEDEKILDVFYERKRLLVDAYEALGEDPSEREERRVNELMIRKIMTKAAQENWENCKQVEHAPIGQGCQIYYGPPPEQFAEKELP